MATKRNVMTGYDIAFIVTLVANDTSQKKKGVDGVSLVRPQSLDGGGGVQVVPPVSNEWRTRAPSDAGVVSFVILTAYGAHVRFRAYVVLCNIVSHVNNSCETIRTHARLERKRGGADTGCQY